MSELTSCSQQNDTVPLWVNKSNQCAVREFGVFILMFLEQKLRLPHFSLCSGSRMSSRSSEPHAVSLWRRKLYYCSSLENQPVTFCFQRQTLSIKALISLQKMACFFRRELKEEGFWMEVKLRVDEYNFMPSKWYVWLWSLKSSHCLGGSTTDCHTEETHSNFMFCFMLSSNSPCCLFSCNLIKNMMRS